MDVSSVVQNRFACRAFRPDPVPGLLVRELLQGAARSPSGGNLQPWRVHGLGGEALARFVEDIGSKFEAGQRERPEYSVYPAGLWEPLRTRRRRAGDHRYTALGTHAGVDAQRELERRNYRFFGAPVGLFFFIDRRAGPPQWADVGMYMQTLMLLAAERGLASCPQEVWSNWPQTVAAQCGIAAPWMLFAGMSLGYADEASPMNGYRTERAALAEFCSFQGV